MKINKSRIIHHQDIALKIQPNPMGKNKLYQAVINLLNNYEKWIIIFSATIEHCIDITNELQKVFDPSIITIYYEKMSSSEQTANSNIWKMK